MRLRHFTVNGYKSFKFSGKYSFCCRFQKLVPMTLLLYFSALNQGDKRMNQQNKIASLAARNFEKDGPSSFKFQYMKNLCSYFYLIRNSQLYLLHFLKTHRKKKPEFFFKKLKGRYFLLGCSRNVNLVCFERLKCNF